MSTSSKTRRAVQSKEAQSFATLAPLQKMAFQCFHAVRREQLEYQPGLVDDMNWYKGKDVATALGYKNPERAIRTHVNKDDKTTLRSLVGKDLSTPTNPNEGATVYINESGVRRLVVKSQLPGASKLAKQLGIKEDTRYLRKEIEIVSFIQEVLTQAMIPFEFQKHVANYRIDLYLPMQKLAIEIDEHGHSNRDATYERAREHRIKEELGCEFMRINPDADNFKLSSCVGHIFNAIRESDNKVTMPFDVSEHSAERSVEEATQRKRQRSSAG